MAICSTAVRSIPARSRQNLIAVRGIPWAARVRVSLPSSIAASTPRSLINAAAGSCVIAESPRIYMLVLVFAADAIRSCPELGRGALV